MERSAANINACSCFLRTNNFHIYMCMLTERRYVFWNGHCLLLYVISNNSFKKCLKSALPGI